ncbi:MAG: ABC-F family ATP-binding cassette domain-containing protein [Bacteroidia bacterium]
MNLVSIENIALSYGEKKLFEELSFGIAQGQKIALVGVNGCGKSSLLKIVAGIEEADAGNISWRNGLKMAYLAQEPVLPEESTVHELVLSSQAPALKLIKEYEDLISLAERSDAQQESLDRITAEIESTDAWGYEHRIKSYLGKLGIHFLDRKVGELSGGQRKRVAIAQALIAEPDLLIMDEPTNHLDLPTIEWLEQTLSTARQSLILVTHDRYFLDAITNEILEMDKGRLFRYEGNYAFFLEKKDERDSLHDRHREKAASLYKKELEWMRQSPKARTTKSKSRMAAGEQLGEAANNFRDKKQVKLFVHQRRIGGTVMEIKKLRKAFGDTKIVNDFSYTFKKKERIGVAGANGTGKTTFINMLLGMVEPDNGKIRIGETIHMGHYRQEMPTFKPNARIIEVVQEVAEAVSYSVNGERIPAGQLLEYFLFPYSTHHNRVETLSGGEKRRLHLLRILITNPNFLILDEPTNDLDLITLRRLEDFLLDFEGCLIVVSHDRFFMDRIVDHLWVFEGEGELRDYPGSYSQYREFLDKEEAKKEANRLASQKTQRKAAVAPEPSRKNKTKRSYKEEREFEDLEKQIPVLEDRQVEIAELLASGESDYEKLTAWTDELENIKNELDEKSDRWLELSMIGE